LYTISYKHKIIHINGCTKVTFGCSETTHRKTWRTDKQIYIPPTMLVGHN